MGGDRAAASWSWRDVILVVIVAAVTVVVADLGLRRLSPPRYVREVTDAVREYEHEDPTVLVIGSSHARTFTYLDAIARRRTDGAVRVMGVPLEWGKFTSYEWVLRERLRPLIEETRAGARTRPSLRHAVLLTAWWDGCGQDGDPPVFNLPSRAWALPHFVRAVADRGLDDHSRNYLTSRWLELWHGSILVSARGHDHLVSALRDAVRPPSPEARRKQQDQHLASWRAIIENGAATLGHPRELAAAERILGYFQAAGVDVTLMLYPLMPITVTERARRTVLEPYSAMMKDLAARRGVRFVDATFDHGLVDGDFQPDFDHLTPAGHDKLGAELLDGKLAFLLDGHGQPAAGPPGGAAK